MLSVVLVCTGRVAAQIDTAREQDPRLEADQEARTVLRFDPRLKPLWLEALARPEADLQRQAAEAIGRAHSLGMPGLQEALPRLLTLLQARDTHPVARLAAVRAVIALDAREAAAALMTRAQLDGLETARLVEPVLARWNHAPMRPVWLRRLDDPGTPRPPLLLAIEAAAALELADAGPGLRRLALDQRQAADLRLEAARALALVQSSGLEADARSLTAGAEPKDIVDRLVAAALLVHHRGPEAEAVLGLLAGDPEPAVAAVAADRLVEIAPARLSSLLPRLTESGDASLRLIAAQALGKLQTVDAIAGLGGLLDDPHRDVRVVARQALVRAGGGAALAEAVHETLTRALSSPGPRALEQAATAAGQLRLANAANRLLKLLGHDDPEVRVPAAWALRRIALPSTAAALLERVRLDTDRPRSPAQRPVLPAEAAIADHYEHLEHLIEALGVLEYRPAQATLRRYLPMPPMPRPPGDNPLWHARLRTAAVWSLGRIGAADAPADLVAALQKRLGGPAGVQDEASVRAAAAVGLGRMKAKDAVPELGQIYRDEMELPAVRRACAWALDRITGMSLPPLKLVVPPREVWQRGWFLEPAGSPP